MTSFNILVSKSVSRAVDVMQVRIMRKFHRLELKGSMHKHANSVFAILRFCILAWQNVYNFFAFYRRESQLISLTSSFYLLSDSVI